MELVRNVADGAVALGAQRLILSGGGLVIDGKLNPEMLKRKAGGLDEAGKYCRSKGLKLAYHNHGPEFAQNALEIEGLYRQTDPALVEFVTDCGWAWRAGANVPAFVIRPEKPEDIAAIHHVVHHAFERAAEADLVDALRRNGKAALSLVAEDNGRVIGHI